MAAHSHLILQTEAKLRLFHSSASVCRSIGEKPLKASQQKVQDHQTSLEHPTHLSALDATTVCLMLVIARRLGYNLVEWPYVLGFAALFYIVSRPSSLRRLLHTWLTFLAAFCVFRSRKVYTRPVGHSISLY